MKRLIFNKHHIIREFKTQEFAYLKILFRNEIETRITGINHDTIGFYRVPKTTKLASYHPRIQHKIEPLVFKKVEEANDICLRR